MILRALGAALLAAGLFVGGCAVDAGGPTGGYDERTGESKSALRSEMSREKILDLAKSGVGFSYDWGGDKWDPESKKYPGKCSGSCPNCSHWAYPSGGPEWGADCSGYVGQVWQVPNNRSLKVQSHPYSTYNFRYEREHWYPVSRSKLRAGDALVYHSGSGGHIALFDRYSSGGRITAYECAGCSIGCIHKPRYFASYYVGIRRRDVTDEPENRMPKGRLTSGTCGTIRGWAQDPDAKKESIDVILSFNGPLGSPNAKKFTAKADVYRKDLCKKLGSCKHGFEVNFPESLIDGKKHSVYAYAVDSSGKGHKLLAGSPRSVKCGSLKASLTAKYSSADRFRGKGADFVACTGQKFDLGLTFKNKGTAVWRDVDGRGNTVGSDIFLVTANGKPDKLTGKKRFSLRENDNSYVRGDHSAPNCVHSKGCRKTLFVDGGMEATAPSKPGVYVSRWRLRDYSKVWNKSHGFGPKVEVRVKVMSCDQPPAECGCHIWCSNGTDELLIGYDIDTPELCKSVGQSKCLPNELVTSSLDPCPEPGAGGTTGSGGSGGAGGWPSGGGSAGAGAGGDPGTGGIAGSSGWAGSSGLGGEGGEPGSEEEENAWNGWEEEEGSSLSPDEEPDDADFDDEGFEGDADEEFAGGTTSLDESKCSIVAVPIERGSRAILIAGFAALALGLRRRSRRPR